jgi:ATP-dependent Clp protease ATP-binding subunit ClpC
MKEKVNDSLKTHFRPEFLNRIDETIVFHELARDEVLQMVDMQMERLIKQLEGQGLGIELKQEAKELLADRGYDPTLGGRPLRRAIQRHIEDSLSEKILYKEFSAGEIIVVDVEDDEEAEGGKKFTFTAVEGFVPPASVELELTATEVPAPEAGTELPPPEAQD